MKPTLLRLWGLAALFFCLLGTAAAQTTVTVLFVFSPEAVATIAAAKGDSMLKFADTQIKQSNKILGDSGATFVLQNAGTISGICCGGETTIMDNTVIYTPGSQGAVKWARNDPTVATWRNSAHADIVVVVHNSTDANDVNGYAPAICATSATAFAGVNLWKAYKDSQVLPHEIAHLLCATHEDGYDIKFGAHLKDCEGDYDIMTDALPSFPIPTAEWWSPAWYGGARVGWGSTPSAANADMASHCPDHNLGYYTYTCASLSCAIPPNSPDSASCNMQFDTYYAPTNYHSTTTYNGVGVSQLHSDGQCPVKVQIYKFSNPNITEGSVPFGDTSHNSIAKMNAYAPTVAGFR